MKRTLSLILALVLALSASLALAEGSSFDTKYFTMPLPYGWTYDDADLEDPDVGEDLGYAYAPDEPAMLIEAYVIYYEDWKNFSLWSSDAEDLQAYIEAVLSDYGDYNAEYVDTVMAGSIPFVIIHCTDEEGEFLYADTMTNGYAVEFLCYLLDEEGTSYRITGADIEQFKTILAGFQPVTGS